MFSIIPTMGQHHCIRWCRYWKVILQFLFDDDHRSFHVSASVLAHLQKIGLKISIQFPRPPQLFMGNLTLTKSCRLTLATRIDRIINHFFVAHSAAQPDGLSLSSWIKGLLNEPCKLYGKY